MEFQLSICDRVVITLAVLSIVLLSLTYTLEDSFCLPHLQLSGIPVFQNHSSQAKEN